MVKYGYVRTRGRVILMINNKRNISIVIALTATMVIAFATACDGMQQR